MDYRKKRYVIIREVTGAQLDARIERKFVALEDGEIGKYGGAKFTEDILRLPLTYPGDVVLGCPSSWVEIVEEFDEARRQYQTNEPSIFAQGGPWEQLGK